MSTQKLIFYDNHSGNHLDLCETNTHNKELLMGNVATIVTQKHSGIQC